MAIISKDLAIQEELSGMYDLLLSKRSKVQKELAHTRTIYQNICDTHIKNGFYCENEWLKADRIHYNKFLEYDMYCHLIDIINDFKDLYGHFPEYNEMFLTLNQIMLQFAQEEKYELAAIVKVWVDKIKQIIKSAPSPQIY